MSTILPVNGLACCAGISPVLSRSYKAKLYSHTKNTKVYRLLYDLKITGFDLDEFQYFVRGMKCSGNRELAQRF